MDEQIKSDTIETRFGIFYVGQPVTYSVYPIIKDGTGMATRYGVLTVGQTYSDVLLSEDGTLIYHDMCAWEEAYDVKPRIVGAE